MVHESLAVLLVLFTTTTCAPLHTRSLSTFGRQLTTPITSSTTFNATGITIARYKSTTQTIGRTSQTNTHLHFPNCQIYVFFSGNRSTHTKTVTTGRLFRRGCPKVGICVICRGPCFGITIKSYLAARRTVVLGNEISSTFPGTFIGGRALSVTSLLG